VTPSVRSIEQAQVAWSRLRALDPRRRRYVATLGENLFLGRLNAETKTEFLAGDGSELHDSDTRPAKMRALLSSSALVVNFFDAWRHADRATLSQALGLPTTIQSLRFEYKPTGYPVRPRSPNLDLLLTLADGRRIAIEAKFTEPYTAATGLSQKYFPVTGGLWEQVGLARAQRLAEELRPRWQHIDAAQLLKHMLGLGSETDAPISLLYLWYDAFVAKHTRRFSPRSPIAQNRIAGGFPTCGRAISASRKLSEHDVRPTGHPYLPPSRVARCMNGCVLLAASPTACVVVFGRWVTPEDAELDLEHLARLN